jgi:hypothetical protein
VEMGLSLSLCGGAAGERVAFFFTRPTWIWLLIGSETSTPHGANMDFIARSVCARWRRGYKLNEANVTLLSDTTIH